MTFARLAVLLVVGSLGIACGGNTSPSTEGLGDDAALTEGGVDTSVVVDTSEPCSTKTCVGPGKGCRKGVCVDDCRPEGAGPCGAATACDFGDGKCKDPKGDCFLGANGPNAFDPCPSPAVPKRACGPGLMCDGAGSCVPALAGCKDVECDDVGRCWGKECACERPPPRCAPASLDELNRADFVGSLVNGRDSEGAFELDFDDICTAYVATMISGPDYVRQLTPDGKLTEWPSTTNLNMGQVAVLKIPGGEFKELGDVAATYICCATCGCIETGADGRLGVIRLDRSSATRPLPNVLPAKPTTGTGPWGSATLDTGPYGLVWGADKALYVGNVEKNGDFMRIDLATAKSSLVATFPARITAAAVYDRLRLLVAIEGGKIMLLTTATGDGKDWSTVAGDVTSLRRDRFTGRVYAELRGAMNDIVEIREDGTGVTSFQKPPRAGRITLGPDGFVYHLSVYPAVEWKTKNAVVRWPLPTKR